MSALPCPTCGADLYYFEQYQRQFCYHCQQYAPEGYGARGEKKCPTCGGILSYVAAYDRFYCYRCGTYPPPEAVATAPPAAGTPTPAASPPIVTPAPTEPAPSLVPAATASSVPAEEPKPEEPKPAAPAEPAAGEPEEELVAEELPPLVHEQILEARKPFLIDLCKAYDLDPSGTKEQLKERLLSYVEEREAASESAVVEAPALEETEELATEEKEPVAVPEERLEGPPAAEPVPAAAQPALAAVVVERPSSAPVADTTAPAVVEPVVAPVFVPVVEEAAPTTPEITAPRKVLNPCPTCGRELDYVSRYDRWYCYSCRAYAPLRSMKRTCPSCGADLRWVEEYARWWCDACREYAPEEFPRFATTAVAVPAAVSPAPAVVEARAAIPTAAVAPATVAAHVVAATGVHRHGNPSAGMGLVAFGLVMWIGYVILVQVPQVFSVTFPVLLTPELAFLLQTAGILFVSLGALVGLSGARERS